MVTVSSGSKKVARKDLFWVKIFWTVITMKQDNKKIKRTLRSRRLQHLKGGSMPAEDGPDSMNLT